MSGKKTVQLDVNVSVPVEVIQDAVATTALEVLKRNIQRGINSALNDFVAHGITATLADVAVKAEKSTIKVSGS